MLEKEVETLKPLLDRLSPAQVVSGYHPPININQANVNCDVWSCVVAPCTCLLLKFAVTICRTDRAAFASLPLRSRWWPHARRCRGLLMLLPAAQGALTMSLGTYAEYLRDVGITVPYNLPSALALSRRPPWRRWRATWSTASPMSSLRCSGHDLLLKGLA